MSETPRVDQVHWNHAFLKEEAYKLERELNAAQQRIKRLEEAGDAMATWLSDPRNLGDDPFMSSQWRKAKEAKP